MARDIAIDRIPFQTLVHEMLEQLGEDPSREGLRQTPARVRGSKLVDGSASITTFRRRNSRGCWRVIRNSRSYLQTARNNCAIV